MTQKNVAKTDLKDYDNYQSVPFVLQNNLEAIQVPGNIVYNVGLQQEFATRKQVFSDEVLVGPHSYTITHTKRSQDIQDLKADVTLTFMFKCGRAEQTIHIFICCLQLLMELKTKCVFMSQICYQDDITFQITT